MSSYEYEKMVVLACALGGVAVLFGLLCLLDMIFCAVASRRDDAKRDKATHE